MIDEFLMFEITICDEVFIILLGEKELATKKHIVVVFENFL